MPVLSAHDRFGKSPMAEAQAAAPRFGPDPMRDLLLAKGGRVFKDVSDDNKLEIDFFLVLIEVVFFILYGFFVRYGDGASGMNAVASATEVTSKYSQFQDVHVMIFIGFGLLMVFLKKYAYSAFTYSEYIMSVARLAVYLKSHIICTFISSVNAFRDCHSVAYSRWWIL